VVTIRRIFVALAVGVALLYVAVGIYAFTDPTFKAHLARVAGLVLAVPVAIAAVSIGLSARARVNQ
jgi:hypothetical protein